MNDLVSDASFASVFIVNQLHFFSVCHSIIFFCWSCFRAKKWSEVSEVNEVSSFKLFFNFFNSRSNHFWEQHAHVPPPNVRYGNLSHSKYERNRKRKVRQRKNNVRETEREKKQYEWISKIKDKQRKEMTFCGKRKRKDSKYNTTEI